MQPSSAFNTLKQLTNAGKWKMIDHTLWSNGARDAEPEMNVLANIVAAPLSDLNRDRINNKELNTNEEQIVRKLKCKAVELDAAVVGNFDDPLNVDKENIDVECMNAIEGSVTVAELQSEWVKHDLLTDDRQDGTPEKVDKSEMDAAVVGNFDVALNVHKENIDVECANTIDGSVTIAELQSEWAKRDLSTDDLDRTPEKVDKSEVDAAVAGNFDDPLNMDKDNIDVECMNAIDGSVRTDQLQSEWVKHDLQTDDRQDRPPEKVDGSDLCDGYDTAAVKLSQFCPKQQRETFSLGTKVPPMCSAMQPPVQSDSIDMVNLIGELADICQRSAADTDDFYTQDIDAREHTSDGFNQQHSAAGSIESLLPVSQCVIQGTSLLSVKDITQRTDLTLDPEPPATAVSAGPCTSAAGHTSHSLPVPEYVSVYAVQINDVPHSLPKNTDWDVVSMNGKDHHQVHVPPAAVAVVECFEAPACDETDSLYTSAVADKICEMKQLHSGELLSSRVYDDTSDIDSESGESLADNIFIVVSEPTGV